MTYSKETQFWELQVQWKKSISMRRYILKKRTDNKCWGRGGTRTLDVEAAFEMCLVASVREDSQFFI